MFSFTERLLHPGANTSDIITTYIATIKSLNLIESSTSKGNSIDGSTANFTNSNRRILDVVTQPIRQYLVGREDTIRYYPSMYSISVDLIALKQ